MIIQIEAIEEILPIFREYLGCMSQFYKIYNFDSWCNAALKNLQKYSAADYRMIYLLKESESVIGFAQVDKHLRFNNDGFSIAEFYIQKEHGRNGCGRKLAEYAFAKFPGNWEVAVTFKNTCALAFWEQVISSYTSGKFKKKKCPPFNGYGFLFNKE